MISGHGIIKDKNINTSSIPDHLGTRIYTSISQLTRNFKNNIRKIKLNNMYFVKQNAVSSACLKHTTDKPQNSKAHYVLLPCGLQFIALYICILLFTCVTVAIWTRYTLFCLTFYAHYIWYMIIYGILTLKGMMI